MPKGSLPRFQVKLGDELRFVYSEDEFEELEKDRRRDPTARAHEETLASIPAEEQTEEMKIFQPQGLPFIELYEEEHLQSSEKALSCLWFCILTIT